MAAAVAMSNYLVLIPINDWFTAGTLTYPLTFLLTDVTNRVFGKRAAQEVVFAGYHPPDLRLQYPVLTPSPPLPSFCAGVPLSLLLSGERIAIASGTAYLTAQVAALLFFSPHDFLPCMLSMLPFMKAALLFPAAALTFPRSFSTCPSSTASATPARGGSLPSAPPSSAVPWIPPSS